MITLLNPHLTAKPRELAVKDAARSLSWEVLDERVARWMGLLSSHGLRFGDTVSIVMGNRCEVFEVLLACLHSGLTIVPVNQHLTTPEIAYLLTDSGSAAVIADEARAQVVAQAVQAAPAVKLFLTTGQQAEQALMSARPWRGEAECGQLMVYTSGTTGSPKGVLNGLFTAGDPFTRVDRLLDYSGRTLGVPADGRVLLVGPWYHSAQLFYALISLLRGATLVIRERFDAEPVLALMQREQITECHLVPTQLVRFLRLDPAVRKAFDPSHLRQIWHGGAACAVDVKRQMIDWWGPVLTEYYGASEGGVVTLIDSAQWLARPGSVGRPVPPNEVLIVDGDGNPVPAGVSGRVFVRRPGRGFRYHNAPEKTKAAHLGPGVFTYGEIGYLDSDGYLFLTGRVQDMIITGGVNVYPAEVEAVLLRHPAVRDAAVVGIPDEEFGERVIAVLELDESGSAPLWQEIDEHCRRSLAGFKVPRQYREVDSLPRESTGKIRKTVLRELMLK